MFASPGNRKYPQYCCRHPHWSAGKIDALTCQLGDISFCYANPPWSIILQWLTRLKEHPHLRCWLIVPYWVSAVWWPLLLKLYIPKSPALLIPARQGMFSNCVGLQMPPPQGGT